mmetsp:Transcript_52505/g.168358  ORF Transcript_52505/g.168358 Transcript_52505/m.168358 type:complete len:219 (-) Transcript_52505:335-991(-)
MTTHRPRGSRRSKAASSARSSCSISRLRKTRTAQKTTCGRCRLGCSSCRSASSSWRSRASWSVDVYGPRSRWRCRMASATRSGRGGSSRWPTAAMTQASWGAVTCCSHSEAGSPTCGFMRRSRGPSFLFLREKPRRVSSSWGDETPRSSNTPATGSRTAEARSPKGRWMMPKRPSACSTALAASTAEGSTSKARSRPSSERRERIRELWPPRPKVQST